MTAKILAGGFLAVMIIAIPMFFAEADQQMQNDDPSFVPGQWQEVQKIEYQQNDPDGSWATQQEVVWTVPAGINGGTVTKVDVYGHSDDGGYCYAYWGGDNPGWVAEYRHQGVGGIYNVDNMSYDGDPSYCPVNPPSFNSSGNAQICQFGYNHGSFSFGKNYLGENKGDVSGAYIPSGTTIHLQARHTIGQASDIVHCYLAVNTTSPDTCPGNDAASPYTCAATDDFTNKTISDTSDDVSCTDINGSQFRTVKCYPDDARGNRMSQCNDDDDRTDTCDGNWNYGPYICGQSEFRQCKDITDRDTGGCGTWGNDIEFDAYTVTCYPDDNYSDWQTPPPYNTSDDGNIVACNNSICIKKDGSIIALPVSPGLVCPVGFGCGGGLQCDSITNVCNEKKLLCSSGSLSGQLPGNEWTKTFRPGTGAAYGYGTAVDGTDVYIVGEAVNAVNANSGLDVFLRKYDEDGNLKWEKFYDDNGNESGYGVAVDTSGRVYVVGKQDTNNSDILLIQFDSSGNQTGVTTYDNGGMDVGRAVAVRSYLPYGVYITGYQQSGTVDTDMVILRYGTFNINGASPDNSTTYGGSNYNEAGNAITISGDDIYTAGYQSINGGDMLLTKSDTSLGHLTSFGTNGVVTYNSGGNNTDIGKGVAVIEASKKVFVTGYRSTSGGDMLLVSYNTDDGSYIAEERIYDSVSGKNNNDIGRGIIKEDHNARLYIVGSQQTSGEDMFLWASGLANPIVELYKGGKDSSSVERGFGLAVVGDIWRGAMYIAGYQDSNGGEMFLSKYSCDAPPAGAATASGNWASLSIAPGTTGNAPFTITATGAVTIPDSVSYTWNWGDGETSTGQIATHTYKNITGAATTPLLTLTAVNLSTTEADTATTTINVGSDTAPTAGFIPTPSIGVAPLLVKVNAAAPLSTDAPPGKIISYKWDWGDGTAPGNGVQTSHIYTNAGIYTIKLTVEDDGGMLPMSTSQNITVTWACTVGTGLEGSCAAPNPVCAPGNKCEQCLADYDCGVGYRCTGTDCQKGDLCPDGNECPIDGKCAELDLNNTAVKNTCVLSSDSLGANCYIEEIPSSCADDLECTASVMGGKCDADTGKCRYARCLNESSLACIKDIDCADGDGICDANVCKYIYDCAYGPGMSSGTIGRYATATSPTMPAMPVGPQPEGQACTQPTPDAPINCQGINGCLYYNFEGDGDPVKDSNNSVANCLDKFNGGTGCVYYQRNGTTTANCLASSDGIAGAKKGIVCVPGNACADGQTCPSNGICLSTPTTAGIPDGCIQIARGKDNKGNVIYDYNCSNIDGCYYKTDGGIDCTYTYNKTLAGPCSQPSDCADMTGSSDKACVNNACAYQFEGNGCVYEPNPEGAIFCPGATKPATGGENYVQCLLNPDAGMPWYLQDRTATTTEACKTNADCSAGNICIDGACYPECQGDLDCATGKSCVPICDTAWDCPTDSYICNAGICMVCLPGDTSCVPAVPFCSGAQPKGNLPFGTSATTISMKTAKDATCRYSLIEGVPFSIMTETFGTTGSTTHSEEVFGLMPLPSINAYFVECQSAGGDIAPACRIEFGVGEPCSEDAQCDGGLSCINGYCQPPYCDGAQPPIGTALPSDTANVVIGLDTDNTAVCNYSQTLPDSLLSKLNQYLSFLSTFSVTGGTTHSDIVTSGLITGNNSYYALCQEAAPPQNITQLCQISFNINVCNEEFKCANGWQCEPNTGNGVCVPPPCSSVSVLPTPDSNNSLPAITTSVTLQATTDETANCAYGNSYSTAFDSMTLFSATGEQAHTADNVSVNSGYNAKYVKCQDSDGINTCSVSFRVGGSCGSDAQCPSDQECENGTCVYPICANAYPSDNLDEGVTEIIMGMTTQIDSDCRYSKTTYDFDSQTDFTNTGGQVHSTLVAELVPKKNTQLISCKGTALPNEIRHCRIPIFVGACTASWDCEFGYGCNLGTGDCKACGDYADGDPNTPPECLPWCERFPWLCNKPCQDPNSPECSNFCEQFPNDPNCKLVAEPASCSFMGITFFGDAVDDDGTCDIMAMILAVISWMAWLVGLLAVLSGLRAAYLYITAMGDGKRLILARSYLIYTTIGVVVAIISFGLVAIVRALMGI